MNSTKVSVKHRTRNDGKHDWKPSRTFPKEFTKMGCSMCGETRNPNGDEMSVIMQS